MSLVCYIPQVDPFSDTSQVYLYHIRKHVDEYSIPVDPVRDTHFYLSLFATRRHCFNRCFYVFSSEDKL